MLRKIHEKTFISAVILFTVTILLTSHYDTSVAITKNDSLEVEVVDSLTVKLSTPSTWASGDITYDNTNGTWSSDFLRNTVNLNVTANSGAITASMYSNTNTNLVNTSDSNATIPTLASSATRAAFPVNRWGYSLDAATVDGITYNETSAGNDSSNYYPLVSDSSNPILLIDNLSSASASRDIYFGAKADLTRTAGTYENTVIISVVTSGSTATPTNPATPNSTEETPTYSGSNTHVGDTTNGATIYSYTRSSGSGSSAISTNTTEVTEGDQRDLYSGYTPPQGVTNRETTTENVYGGSSLITGLAATSVVTATSGIIFFILAKRKKDDDEDEEENQS